MKTIILLFIMLLLSSVVLADNYPQRIVSLGPVITEELYLLGVENRIVGVTTYCIRPEEVRGKEKIGTITDIDIERTVELQPDIVLATEMSDSDDLDKLSQLGIKIVRFPYYKDFSDICSQFMKLAEIVGEKEKAQEIITSVTKEVELIEEKTKDLPKPKVFIQIGADPLFTVTEDEFINDFIKLAGGMNIVGRLKTGLYNTEDVIKRNPQIIIITTMGFIAKREKEKWQRFKELDAVKNNRIYIIDPYKVCSPTPVGFVETLKEITKILHLNNE